MQKMSDQLCQRIFDEDLRSHERRFELLKLKVALSFGLFGIGSIRIGQSDVNSYLFLILPLVPILIDFANLGESYNLKRNMKFLKGHGKEELGLFVEHINIHRNPIYLGTYLALTVSICLGAVLLFNLSAPTSIYWCNIFYLPIFVLSVFLYLYFCRRITGLSKIQEDEDAPAGAGDSCYDIDSPNYLSKSFRYCPRCSSLSLHAETAKVLKCSYCGFEYYVNASAAVAALITDSEGNLLVTVRAKEPAKGALDLPGGFVDPGESAEKALRREVKEELGLDLSSMSYLYSLPNVYEYKEITYSTVDLVYTCCVEDAREAQAGDDAAEVLFKSVGEIDPQEFGLASIKEIVTRYIAKPSR